MNNYLSFCKKCCEGKIGFRPDYHIIGNSDNADNSKPKIYVTVVTPTQAAVDQAKNEIKHEKIINNSNSSKYHQSGGRSSKRKEVIRNKPIHKVVKKKLHNKNQNQKKQIKKNKNKKRETGVLNSYRKIWM